MPSITRCSVRVPTLALTTNRTPIWRHPRRSVCSANNSIHRDIFRWAYGSTSRRASQPRDQGPSLKDGPFFYIGSGGEANALLSWIRKLQTGDNLIFKSRLRTTRRGFLQLSAMAGGTAVRVVIKSGSSSLRAKAPFLLIRSWDRNSTGVCFQISPNLGRRTHSPRRKTSTSARAHRKCSKMRKDGLSEPADWSKDQQHWP